MIRCLFVIVSAVLSGSCTIIELHGAERATLFKAGILHIAPHAGAGSVSYRATGVGLVPGLNGLTVGFSREDAVLVFDPDDCRTIIFESPPDAAALRDIIEAGNVCRPGGGDR